MRALRTAASLSLALLALACNDPTPEPVPGQTEFLSAPPGGSGSRGGAVDDTASPPSASGAEKTTTTRTVEETDLYRLEGDRLYFLNSYRGLMVFDVSDVDHPKLLGRSPIYGYPVEMIVRNGVAVVVVADWYGLKEDGSPFHGSIVRGLDARDPKNIKVLGEARLGGWTTDTRVVGDVLYAVSVDYGWLYGWDVAVAASDGVATTTSAPRESVIVSSVSFAGGAIKAVGKQEYAGYSGIFNVTPNSILLAHAAGGTDATQPTPARTSLLYLDISDPGGNIVPRGELTVSGTVQGWGADSGRWNLDFADGKTARVIGCAGNYYWSCGYSGGYVLSVADFSNPDAPVLRGELDIATTGYGVTARFAGSYLYLSPQNWDTWGTGQVATPFQVFDTSDPTRPRLAGTTAVPGMVWNLLPVSDDRLFALGNDWDRGYTGSAVSLKYLDVSNPASPRLLGNAAFGDGWAWTPAAGTFKAFTMDAQKGLVVLPFSGWSQTSQGYVNGLQLISFSDTAEKVAGAARTRGWVERGIFVDDRLVALSDLALSVVDYTNREAPVVISELTLARNVVAAQPGATSIATVVSDFWDYDVTTSEVRVLPLADAEELTGDARAISATVDGVNARVFRSGELAYIVTSVRVEATCDSAGAAIDPKGTGEVGTRCYKRAQQVQVVDLAGGGARLRGKIRLPGDTWAYWYWGFIDCFPWDWYGGSEVVQVGTRALAFRRWQPIYDAQGRYVDTNTRLYVVDLTDPDAPVLASTTIVDDPRGWWGNLRVVGDVLYVTHYEWFDRPDDAPGTVRYFVDPIDLSDLRHPRVGGKINVPGLLVGGSAADPAVLYTVDYRWDGNASRNDFNVVRLRNGKAHLLSHVGLDGWVGTTVVRGTKAYFSSENYDQTTGTHLALHALDLTDPSHPVDRVSKTKDGWGWLLDVLGDRAIVTSGWGASGVDIYSLAEGQAPVFRQFARTQGYYPNAISRLGNALYLATGSWGVQRIVLE